MHTGRTYKEYLMQKIEPLRTISPVSS